MPAGCAVRRRPAPAADPPGCLGGVRRWRPRFPLTSSASAAGCRVPGRVGVRSHRVPSFVDCTRLESVFTFKTHTTYYGDILTQSNSGTYLHNLTQEKRVPSPRPLGPYLGARTVQILQPSFDRFFSFDGLHRLSSWSHRAPRSR